MTNHPAGLQPQLFGSPQTAKTSNDYYTPAWIFERMAIEFDLDVAAPPGGVPWIPTRRFYTLEDDGLSKPWGQGRVWMNPPYSETTRWARRFIQHGHGVCLVPHAKSAWHIELWEAADGVAVPDHFFDFVGGSIFLPVWFAAFGEECVDAISRLGTVRRAA